MWQSNSRGSASHRGHGLPLEVRRRQHQSFICEERGVKRGGDGRRDDGDDDRCRSSRRRDGRRIRHRRLLSRLLTRETRCTSARQCRSQCALDWPSHKARAVKRNSAESQARGFVRLNRLRFHVSFAMVTGFRTARGLPMEHRFTLRSGAFGRRGLAISGLTPPYLP